MASLSNYDLATLRDELLDEFGLSTDTTNKTKATNKINEAIQWINRKRRSWPWLNRPLLISVPAPVTGTCDVTNGSTTVNNISGISKRQKIIFAGQATPSGEASAYRIVSVSGTTATLDTPYRGSTATGVSFTAYTDSFAVPSDFAAMIRVYDVSTPTTHLLYRDPVRFEDIRRYNYGTTYNRYYTVTGDPLDPTTSSSDPVYYLNVYPFPDKQTVYRGFYRIDEKSLVNDTDVPIIPRKHRLVLQYVAEWLMAVKLKHQPDIIRHYEQKAATALQDMLDQYNFTEEEDEHFKDDVLDVDMPFDFPIRS